ncbi:hypothetical protein BaRGS_00019370, partial [Batillaria attramentaria]
MVHGATGGTQAAQTCGPETSGTTDTVSTSTTPLLPELSMVRGATGSTQAAQTCGPETSGTTDTVSTSTTPLLPELSMVRGATGSTQVVQTCGPETSGTTDTVSASSIISPNERPSIEPQPAPKQAVLPKDLREHLLLILSGLYGLLIVVLGAVLPVVETFPHSKHPFLFEAFYVYLYLTSIGFLLYFYVYVLGKQKLVFVRTISRKFRNGFRWSVGGNNGSNAAQGANLPRTWSTKSCGSVQSSDGRVRSRGRRRSRKIAYNEKPNHHTGSFYLRAGAIAFGAGSMIHSGLNVSHYFEIMRMGSPCSHVIQGIKPLLHLLFNFVQMYFIFVNSKMCINHQKTFARFGFMHMSSTNICVCCVPLSWRLFTTFRSRNET